MTEKYRILIVEDDLSVRYPVQDFGLPLFAHKHVTRPAQVLLSPRACQRIDDSATRLRVAATIAMILLVAFGAGAAM